MARAAGYFARLALSPSTPRVPRPCGLRGLTAQRGQAMGYHAKNAEKSASWSERRCRTGDIGNGLRAERVVEGLQGLLLQVEVS